MSGEPWTIPEGGFDDAECAAAAAAIIAHAAKVAGVTDTVSFPADLQIALKQVGTVTTRNLSAEAMVRLARYRIDVQMPPGQPIRFVLKYVDIADVQQIIAGEQGETGGAGGAVAAALASAAGAAAAAVVSGGGDGGAARPRGGGARVYALLTALGSGAVAVTATCAALHQIRAIASFVGPLLYAGA